MMLGPAIWYVGMAYLAGGLGARAVGHRSQQEAPKPRPAVGGDHHQVVIARSVRNVIDGIPDLDA